MYIKISRVGNLELTPENFTNVYFRCPICKQETSRNAEEYFSCMTKYGYRLTEPVLCWDCLQIYCEQRVDLKQACRTIPEAELHTTAMNLTKKIIKGV